MVPKKQKPRKHFWNGSKKCQVRRTVFGRLPTRTRSTENLLEWFRKVAGTFLEWIQKVPGPQTHFWNGSRKCQLHRNIFGMVPKSASSTNAFLKWFHKMPIPRKHFWNGSKNTPVPQKHFWNGSKRCKAHRTIFWNGFKKRQVQRSMFGMVPESASSTSAFWE